MPRLLFPLSLALLLGISSPAVSQDAGQSRRHFTARDTLRLRQVSSPRLSPDGAWVLYTRRERDLDDEELKARTQIWRVRSEGGSRRQMTFGSESSTSPAWFPDGRRIAFLSARGAKKKGTREAGGPRRQIFFLYADGGEAWPATHHKEGIEDFRIAPDGRRIVFLAPDALSPEEKEKKKKKDDAEVVGKKVRYRHLWLLELESGKTRRLTEGHFVLSDPRWSPDSTEIAYVRRPNRRINESWKSDIWVVDLEGHTRQLVQNPGRDSAPRWSPDGHRIAFLSEPTPGTNTWHNRIELVPASGGKARVLLGSTRWNPQDLAWSRDGRSLFSSAGERTTVNLLRVDASSGSVTRLEAPRGSNRQWELSRSGDRWVWVHSSANWPGEVYSAGPGLSEPRRLSDANTWIRQEGIELARVRVVHWTNRDGQRIEGVLTLPAGYRKGERYPLILNPHGGPSGAVTESFRFVNQFLAGHGFMILQPNFRGSANYGQAFLNANRGFWGIRDYDDCMTGVDYCIRQGWADPKRLLCYGWSYGGYLSFWISTQTDRFRAISPGAGLTDLYSMYSTTDIPHYLGWFFADPKQQHAFLGTPWERPGIYDRLSPIRHVRDVKTPLLILHGGNDHRVPPTQAVEFYQALRDLGKEVTFVRYPREGHGLREPRHQVDRLRRYLEFFARHVGLELKEAPAGKPPTRAAGTRSH